MQYIDRKDAGIVLAKLLEKYIAKQNTIILAIPRGGVPVAYEIATALSTELDIYIVRKLGVPGQEELAMGAIVADKITILNNEIINKLNIDPKAINKVKKIEVEELHRRELAYRSNRPHPNLNGKTIILVDDGIATGSTIKAAITGLKIQSPKEIIVAVPVAAKETIDELKKLVSTIICPLIPDNLHDVGSWYENFTQTTDKEVIELLAKATQNFKNIKTPNRGSINT